MWLILHYLLKNNYLTKYKNPLFLSDKMGINQFVYLIEQNA